MSKNSIKVVVIDDEAPAREEILHLLSQCDGIEVVGSAKDGIEAEILLDKVEVDLIFLDIQMPGLSGIDFAKKLLLEERGVNFIFTTAYNEFAVEAFDIHAVDYLLKPLRLCKLKRAIDRAHSHNNRTKDIDFLNSFNTSKEKTSRFLSVYSGDSIIPLKIADIVYAEAKGRYTWITSNGKEYKTGLNFKQMEEQLLLPDFFQCHRSYIININKIESIELGVNNNYLLRLEGVSAVIPVSRNRKEELQRILSI